MKNSAKTKAAGAGWLLAAVVCILSPGAVADGVQRILPLYRVGESLALDNDGRITVDPGKDGWGYVYSPDSGLGERASSTCRITATSPAGQKIAEWWRYETDPRVYRPDNTGEKITSTSSRSYNGGVVYANGVTADNIYADKETFLRFLSSIGVDIVLNGIVSKNGYNSYSSLEEIIWYYTNLDSPDYMYYVSLEEVKADIEKRRGESLDGILDAITTFTWKYDEDIAMVQYVVVSYDWTSYTLAYRLGTESGAATSTSKQSYTNEVTVAAADLFEKAGYEFVCWTNASGKVFAPGAKVTGADLGEPGDGETVTLWACWKPNSYSVRFDANGGEGEMASEPFAYDDAQKLTGVGFERLGYTFAGWARSATGKVVYADEGEVKNLAAGSGAEAILYAVWTPNTYSVVFDGNGASNTVMAAQSFTYGEEKALSGNLFTRAGYRFDGWALSKTGEAVFADRQAVANLTAAAGAQVRLYAVWEGVEYSVEFESNGGAGEMAPAEFRYGESAPLPVCEFTREGYTFAGWALSSASSAKVTYADGEMVKNLAAAEGATARLWALWKPIAYTVRFHSGGGTGTMDDMALVYDASRQQLPTNAFTREGYEFAGWAGSDGGTYSERESIRNLAATDGGVVALAAIWSNITYTVEYNANGGSGAPARQTLVYGEAEALSSEVPVRAGFDFVAWQGEDGTLYAPGEVVRNLASKKGATVKLSAVWNDATYSVHYVANGGTGEMATGVFAYGKSGKLAANAFTREGYVFDGWSRSEDGDVEYSSGASVTNDLATREEAAVALYAVWSPIDYTVRFDPNGGEHAVVPTNRVTQSFTYGEAEALATNEYVRAGYVFAGWSLEKNGPVVYADGAKAGNLAVRSGASVSLYAVWQPETYSVEYDGAGGEGEMLRGVYENGVAFDTAQCHFTRTGYTFAGWSTNAFGTAQVTLSAKWAPIEYTVEFLAGAGEGTMEEQQFKYGDEQALSTNCFTRTGYTFAGWAKSKYGEKVYDDGEVVQDLSVFDGSKVTLWALWTPNEYSVEFDSNGGAGTMEAQTLKYDEEQALSANAFTRDGYAFAGWTTNETGAVVYADGAKVLNLATEGTVTLYAVWCEEHTVTFAPNGGTGTMEEATFLGTYTVPACAFERTGYKFSCWTNEDAQVSYDPKDTLTNSATLKAIWTANTYTLYLDPAGGDGARDEEIDRLEFACDVAGTATVAKVEWTEVGMVYDSPKEVASFAKDKYERSGYELAYWTNTVENIGFGPDDTISNLLATADGEITMRAVWNYTNDVGNFSRAMHCTSLVWKQEKEAGEDYSGEWTILGNASDGYEGVQMSIANPVYKSPHLVANIPNSSGLLEFEWYAEWDALSGNNPPVLAIMYGQYGDDITTNIIAKAEDNGQWQTVYINGISRAQVDIYVNTTEYTIAQDAVVRIDEMKYYPAAYGVIGFDPNGGTGTMAEQQFIYDVPAALAENAFTREGYTFGGWATNETDEVVYQDGETLVITYLSEDYEAGKIATLYAVWIEEKDSGNGGEGSGGSGGSGEGEEESVSGGESDTPASTAKPHYSIVFEPNGAEGVMARLDLDCDEDVTLPANAFVKAWHTFAGWRSDDGESFADGASTNALSSVDGDVITLTAQWTANSWMVKYYDGNLDSESEANPASVLDSPLAERKGYTFVGWATSPNSIEAAYAPGAALGNFAAAPGEVLSLWALWQANEYTIHFEPGTGEGEMDDMLVAYDSPVKLPANLFTCSTERFVGWRSDSGDVYSNGATVTNLASSAGATATLTALWAGDDWGVIGYSAGGGTGTMAVAVFDYGAAPVAPECTFERTGYTFAGWATSAGGEASIQPGEDMNALLASPSSVVTLHAVWRCNGYTIAFASGDETASGEMAPLECKWGEAARLNANAFTLAGHTFAGWALTPGGAVLYDDEDEVINLAATDGAAVTLYAVWSLNEYTLDYDANGGTGEMDGTILLYGEELTLPICGFVNEGSTFAGWSLNANAAKAEFAAGTVVSNLTSTDAALLYAIWAPREITVSFDPNGGQGATGNVVLTNGLEAVMPSSGFTRAGYEFIGWAYSPDAQDIDFEALETVDSLDSASGALTLYAVWAPEEYEITFDANGGTGDMEPVALEYGDERNLPRCDFLRPGYSFAGWATSATGAAVYDDGALVKGLKDDIDLYAVWQAHSYTVAFNANGGTGTMGEQAFAYNESKALSSNALTHASYKFAGWALSPNGKVVYADSAVVTGLTAKDGSEVQLYAVWRDPSSLEPETPNPPVTPGDDDDPDDDSDEDYILHPSEESVIDEFTASSAATYNGWVSDSDGRIQGLLTVKTAAVRSAGRTSKSTIKYTPLVGRKATYRTTVAPGGNPVDEYGIIYGDLGLCGTFQGMPVNAARDFSKSKLAAEKALVSEMPARGESWTCAILDSSNKYNLFSMTFARNGKARVAGTLADGSRMSLTVQGVLGEDYAFALPVVYPRKGIGFVFWIFADGKCDVSAMADEGWALSAVGSKSNLSAGTHAMEFELPDWREYLDEVDGFALTPAGESIITVATGGKWSVTRKVGTVTAASGVPYVRYNASRQTPANLGSLRLSYTASSGIVKGSFKLYYLNGTRVRTDTVTVSGMVISSRFVGTATVKKFDSFPVEIK